MPDFVISRCAKSSSDLSPSRGSFLGHPRRSRTTMFTGGHVIDQDPPPLTQRAPRGPSVDPRAFKGGAVRSCASPTFTSLRIDNAATARRRKEGVKLGQIIWTPIGRERPRTRYSRTPSDSGAGNINDLRSSRSRCRSAPGRARRAISSGRSTCRRSIPIQRSTRAGRQSSHRVCVTIRGVERI